MIPALFIGHGSPMIALEDNEFTKNMRRIGETFPDIKGILSISAHWYKDEFLLQCQDEPKQVYDFYGFPDELYEVKYPAKGSKVLSKEVYKLIEEDTSIDNDWGIDHGTWTVLKHIFPKANIPVIQLSINKNASPEEMRRIGNKLKPLRDEGWLLMGSGNIVHNLRELNWSFNDGTKEADDFDVFIKESILKGNFDEVIKYKGHPASRFAVPIADHFSPLLYILGAVEEKEDVEVFNEKRLMGSISMTSYLFKG